LYGDEQTIEAQALLAILVKEEKALLRLTPLVQDLATAKQMDLASAADIVAKSFATSNNLLGRYGIEVTGAAGSAARLESVVNSLNKAVGGQAEAAAKVGISAIQRYENALGDLQETIGTQLLPQFSGFFEFLTNKIIPAFSTFANAISNLKWTNLLSPLGAVAKIAAETREELRRLAQVDLVNARGEMLIERFNAVVDKGADLQLTFGRAVKSANREYEEQVRLFGEGSPQAEAARLILVRLKETYLQLVTPVKAVAKTTEELFALWEKENKARVTLLELKEIYEDLEKSIMGTGQAYEKLVGQVFGRDIENKPIIIDIIPRFTEDIEGDAAAAELERIITERGIVATARAEGARLNLVKEFTMKTEEERQAIIQEFYDSGLTDFAAFLAQKKQLAIDSEKAVQEDLRDIITRGAQDTAGELINLQRAQNSIQFQTEMQRIDQTNRAELDNLNNALNSKQISQQTYQEKVRQLEAETEEKRKQLRIQQAQQEKRLALAMAAINIAVAVTKNIATPPLAIATAIAGAVQLGLIAAQPIPTFHQGGVFGEDAGGKLTTGALRPDEGIAKLQVGERIIDRKNSRFYHPELEAISKGNFEQFMYQKYILPTLSGAGGGVMKHDVTARLHDANIVNNLRAIKNTEKKGFEMLASTLNQHSRRRAFLN
jgi:hypothetical protein